MERCSWPLAHGLLFALLIIGFTHTAASAEDIPGQHPGVLWVLESQGVAKVATFTGEIRFELADTVAVEVMTVDAETGNLWTYGERRLRAFAPDGEVLVDLSLATLPTDAATALAVDPRGSQLWLAIDTTLYRIGMLGDIHGQNDYPNTIAALAFDPERQRVWVAEGFHLHGLARDGVTFADVQFATAVIKDIHFDADAARLWVAHDGVSWRDPDGAGGADHASPVHPHPESIRGDGTGSAWVASLHELALVDGDGGTSVHFAPFGLGKLGSGPGSPGGLDCKGGGRMIGHGIDRQDRSFWVANNKCVHKYSANAERLLEFRFEIDGSPRNVDALALHFDNIPPEIYFTSPEDGSYINVSIPEIALSYFDIGSAVNPDSLEILHESAGLAVDCTRDGFGAVCTPLAPIADGDIVLSATVEDFAVNVSKSATVTFTVDTQAPQLTGLLPADGLLTRAREQHVVGAFDEPVLAAVNGIGVLADYQNAFAHDIVLREGINRLNLHAIDRAGNTAGVAVSYTLDTRSPRVTLTEPQDGTITNEPATVLHGIVSEASRLFVNNEPIALNVARAFEKAVTLAEGGNNFVFTARDDAGNESIYPFTLILDTVIPAPVEPENVRITEVTANANTLLLGDIREFLIEGRISAQEAEALIEVYRAQRDANGDDNTGMLVRIPVNADGMFSGQFNSNNECTQPLQAQVGTQSQPCPTEFIIRVVDQAGNRSGGVLLTPPVNEDRTTKVVGALAGEFSVDPAGAANYRIPIQVPPGAAGMQPDLTFLYSSRAGNGHLGVGWSLSGLSAISRCPRTRAQDGAFRGVQYDADDRFCLDGQRLQVVNGDYGAPGSEYRTEIASFQKVMAEGGSMENGPARFKVWDKAGLIRTYEKIAVQDGDAALLWPVKRIEDRYGNYFDYHYTVQNGENERGEHWLERISWHNNNGVEIGAAEFAYDGERPDKTHGFLPNGARSAMTRRLHGIEISAGNAFVRRYELRYQQDPVTANSLLYGVTMCAADGCLPLTTFEWLSGTGKPTAPRRYSTKKEVLLLDLDQDSRVDLLYGLADAFPLDPKFGSLYVRYGHTPDAEVKLDTEFFPLSDKIAFARALDYDGDGDQDVLIPNDFCDAWRVQRNDNGRLVNQGCLIGLQSFDSVAVPIDLHADGTQELLLRSAGGRLRAHYWNGDNWQARDLQLVLDDEQRVQVGDFTGDGHADLHISSHGCTFDGDGGGGGGGGQTPNDPPIRIELVNQDLVDYHDRFFREPGTRFEPEPPVHCEGAGTENHCEPDDPFPTPAPPPAESVCEAGEFFIAEDDGFVPGNETGRHYFRYRNVRILDANGDGLSDLLFYSDIGPNTWKLRLNSGTGFVSTEWNLSSPDDSELHQARIVDWNHDGKQDFLVPRDGKWRVAESTGIGFRGLKSTGIDDRGKTSLAFADADGDGHADMLYEHDNDWHIAPTRSRPAALLTKVTDGFGRIVQVNYGVLTAGEGSWYLGHDDLGMGDTPASAHTHGTLRDGEFAEIRDLLAPIPAVHSYGVDSGRVDARGNPVLVHTRYRYKGAKFDAAGRGFLGFHEVHALNVNAAIETVNRHRQDWPFTGMVYRSTQRIAAAPVLDSTPEDITADRPRSCWDGVPPADDLPVGVEPQAAPLSTCDVAQTKAVATEKLQARLAGATVVSETVNSLTSREIGGRPFPHVEQSVQTQFGINTGAAYKRMRTSYVYDVDGNATQVTVETDDGVSDYSDAFKIVTTNTYTDNKAHWCIGRLTRAEVRHQAPGTNTITRVSEFRYRQDETCRLFQEIVEPGTQFEVVKTSDFDAFGNRISQTLSTAAAGERSFAPRTTLTPYDDNGVFPERVENALGHRESYVWDARFGVKRFSTGPNGLTTQWQYDGFGWLVKTVAPRTASATTTQRHWCAVSDCRASAAVWRTLDSSTVGGRTIVEYDKLGRKVLVRTLGLNGTETFVETRYDLLGRSYLSSLPYFADDSKRCWVFNEYDALGRVVAEHRPAGYHECATAGAALPGPNAADHATVAAMSAVTTFNFNGLQTVTHPPASAAVESGLARTLTRRTDVLGRVVFVQEYDDAGAALMTRYAYDAQGNTLQVTPPDGAVVTMQYDRNGHKNRMLDPDMGEWTYVHNALGELVRQTDAKGQTVTMSYDALGRMIERRELEGLTVWTYDNAPGAGIGKPAAVRQYASATADPAQLVFAEAQQYTAFGELEQTLRVIDGRGYWSTFAYDAFGRPLETVYPSPRDIAANAADLTVLVSARPDAGDALRLRHTYDLASGALEAVHRTDGGKNARIWEALAVDPAGALLKARIGFAPGTGNAGGIHVCRSVDRATGRQHSLSAAWGSCNASAYLHQDYRWDIAGNLMQKTDHLRGVSEHYRYDRLYRLTYVQRDLPHGNFTYPPFDTRNTYGITGNIAHKGDNFRDYRYGDSILTGTAGPHAVTAVDIHSGGAFSHTRRFTYDANGNLDGVAGNGTDDLAIAWTSYNKPARIDKGSAYSAFAYGPDRARFKHVKQDSAGETQIVTTLGAFERVETIQPDGTTTLHYRHHLAGGAGTAAILTTTRIAGTPPTTVEQLDYLLRDHQGSVVGIVDANGNRTQTLTYDAWGKRVNETNLSDYAPGFERYTLLGDLNQLPTPRGYTGHEMLDHLGLIHMNGRIYLPEIGRFLSADPFVQFPESTQGYNRYSYVGNNPLSYTDPSGFFSLKGLIFGGILGALNPELAGKIIGVLGPIVSVFCGPAYAACATAAGAVSGYLQTGSLRQAFKSAGMAAVAAGIGQGAQLRFGGTTAGAIATRAAIQGVAGGILSEAGGGRFGDGFLGGAAGSLAGNIAPTGNVIGDVIVGAIAGGTVAEIGGMKFANGAISGAFAVAVGNMTNSSEKGGALDAAPGAGNGHRKITADVDGDGVADITFVNDDPNSLSTDMAVREVVATMVEDVVLSTGLDININSTVRGPCTTSAHCYANAVDINRINGMRVDDPANLGNVAKLQEAFQQHANIRENYGPVMNMKTVPGSVLDRSHIMQIVEKHRNHIHASGRF